MLFQLYNLSGFVGKRNVNICGLEIYLKIVLILIIAPFHGLEKGEEFEEFIIQFADWYQKKWGGIVACGVGIRADESLNRFRTITFDGKIMYDNKRWTTRIKYHDRTLDIYNFYPIYDWKTQDIWGTVSKFNLLFNEVYELMYKNGLSIHEQRLCQPYGDDQKNGLDQFKALEYDTWAKVVNRVNGVNFGNIYCKTSALGNIKSSKPDFMTWKEYTIFLLESIGIYNSDLMLHYYRKIKKFADWYKRRDGIDMCDIPDVANTKLENQKKVISWRRIARAIEKNDFYMKRLCFTQTKADDEELRRLIHTWDNLLTEDTISDDKDLNNFMRKEVIKSDYKNNK